MSRRAWLGVIVVATIGATIVFSKICWFKENEHVAVWLEGAALIFIFGLDYFNRLDEGIEQNRRREETLTQLRALNLQAEAAKRQADSSSESLHLLKMQAQEQQLRELWRVLPILDEIQGQMRYWKNLFDENRWNSVNEATRIMPVDSSIVVIQAGRHSNELWIEVRETFQMITKADYQISQFYLQDNPGYRQNSLITAAHGNLRNAEPKLTGIVDAFKVFEEAERTRITSQQGER
jgi:hypothetical protein